MTSETMDPAPGARPITRSTPAGHRPPNEEDAPEPGGGAGQVPRWIRWIVLANLALVGVQSLSAGLLLSGVEGAARGHSLVAAGLLAGALVQAVSCAVLWRRRRLPPAVAAGSFGLLAALITQVGLGHTAVHWLHVPLGVGLFGALVLQASRLWSGRRTSGAGRETARAGK